MLWRDAVAGRPFRGSIFSTLSWMLSCSGPDRLLGDRDQRRAEARSEAPAPVSDTTSLDARAQQSTHGAARVRRHARVFFHRRRSHRLLRAIVRNAAMDRDGAAADGTRDWRWSAVRGGAGD